VGGIVGVFPVLVSIFPFLDPLRRTRKAPEFSEDKAASGPEGFLRVCGLDALTVGAPPQRFSVISDQTDAWNFSPRQPIGAVYADRPDNETVRVFNVTCPHAGCSVSCDGAAYVCPCHNSSFELDGSKRTSDSGRENPSPRPLDELVVDPTSLAAGDVWVEFKNFYPGRKEKTAKS
jgi:nitrite reductase/ring-hydroxylating ferredoxin subunit